MFKAVLFDLDGVITDTAEYHFLAWKKLGDELGISIDREFNEQLKGVSRTESLQRILASGGREHDFSAEEFEALAKRKNDNYVEMIQDVSSKDVYPGILELLQELKEHGLKIALASASKNGPLLLEKMTLTDYFDVIADPAKVAEGKPAPDIFLAAAAGVGVNADEAIGIEDAQAGIQAIKAAGALPIGVGESDVLGNDISVVKDTSELTLDYLKKVWNKR
ncbi:MULTISPECIES: beta-phosphoglucomutase [unclassified Enterococcus]|uniref:beta-phosphoglucomutase n=1 Tax=unclassified Enterococcus TaxID=2608891 RepID=UPI001CE09887|nr:MULTISPECIES: beta-phosphoglucomutase [unclassified Enterococcus]MCA5013702.1 beta-phosphoglucomutase [Enterococcus sp. S23]MCA5016952.1 beta-phosphoglucomutase [Enterococcus sp. S22(2020)]